MLHRVAIVGCGATKRAYAAPAGDLYQGGYFMACSAYARRFFKDWRIVSAKYGLLEPAAVIEPYDCCLDTFTAAELADWGKLVQGQLAKAFDIENTEFYLLTGEAYSSAFTGLPRVFNVFASLKPDGMGYRMGFLKKALQPARRKLI
jgi:cytoplasmic iron level regulating protein YaaA (DUF328/UPF0246 family)